MIRNLLLFTILCSTLVACQHSPRKHYFLLTASSSSSQLNVNNTSTQDATKANSDNLVNLIGIGPIDIADYLDRSHIVYTENDNTLTVMDNDYWAEPLEKGIARVIALNLTQLDPTRSFVNFPWRSDSKPQYSLRIHLHSLARINNQATIDATWELIDNNNKNNIQRKKFTQSIAVGSSSKELVQGYSRLLSALTEEINVTLK